MDKTNLIRTGKYNPSPGRTKQLCTIIQFKYARVIRIVPLDLKSLNTTFTSIISLYPYVFCEIKNAVVLFYSS